VPVGGRPGGFSGQTIVANQQPLMLLGPRSGPNLAAYYQQPSSGGSRLWLPSDLGSKLNMWLKGDDLTGSNGSSVTTWADASGNGQNATITASDTAAPTLHASGQNGMNTVAFAAGSSQSMTLPTTLMGARDGTSGSATFAMFKITADPPPDDAHDGPLLGTFGSSTDSQLWPYYGDGTWYDDYCTDTHRAVSAVPSSTAFRQIGLRSKSGAWQFWMDGTNYADLTGTTFSAGAYTWALALGRHWINSRRFDGEAAEIVDCVDYLTTAERQQVEGYLAWKWGRQAALPSGHPYASAAPTVGTSGTTYNDNLSESLTGADSLSPAGSTFGVPLSEVLTSAATYATAATFSSALSEGLTASDSNLGGLLLTATLNEALTGSDSAATAMTFGPSLSEAATAVASLATQAVFGSAVSEGLAAADTPSNLGTFPNPLSEALAANDNLAATATFPNSLSETGTLNAVFSTGATTYNDTLTESLTASAALSGGLFLAAALSEAATATASQSSVAMFGATLGEALTAAEGTTAAATMPAALSEAASLSSALSAGLTILAQRSEASVVSDALSGSAGLFAAVLEQASAGDDVIVGLLIDGGLDESIAANDELLGFIGSPPAVPANRTSHAEPGLAGTAASAMATTSAEPGLRTTYAPKRAA